MLTGQEEEGIFRDDGYAAHPRRAREQPQVGYSLLPDSEPQVKCWGKKSGRNRSVCTRLTGEASWRRHELRQVLVGQEATSHRE